MNFPYRKILKQAYEIVRENKFLWIFGLFLFWGNLLSVSYVFQNQGWNPQPFLNVHPFWANLSLLLVFTIIFGLVLLFFRAQAANILSVSAILNKQEASFKKGFRNAGLFHWRLFGISVLMQLVLFLLGILVGVPILYLLSLKLFTRAVILGILGLVILVPASLAAALINSLAPMFVVLHDLKIGEAIHRGLELVSEFWLPLLLFGFLLLCLTVLAFFLSLFVAGLASSPFVLLTYLVYHRGSLGVGVPLTAAAVTVGSIAFLIIQAALATFQQTAWVLVFLELIKPQKLDREESLPVPETVS